METDPHEHEDVKSGLIQRNVAQELEEFEQQLPSTVVHEVSGPEPLKGVDGKPGAFRVGENVSSQLSSQLADFESTLDARRMPPPPPRNLTEETQDNEEGLAVALPVEEGDEDPLRPLPAAVEFDPDSKPAVSPVRKRFLIRTCSAFFVLTILTVGGVVGLILGLSSGGEDSGTTPNPREFLGIGEFIESQVGMDLFEDEVSPYSKALRWIIRDDPMQLTLESANLLQRFAAASVYFATSTDKPWAYCNPPAEGQFSNCAYRSPFLAGEFPAFRWLSEEHECVWAGVNCAESTIIAINTEGFAMAGPVPQGVSLFPFLSFLSMGHGQLSGTIPASLLSMKHLTRLYLERNNFHGPFPEAFFESRILTQLLIGGNSLSGPLPTSIGQAVDLKGFMIDGNAVNGTLPSVIGDLQSLADIWIDGNQFSGSIPTVLGNIEHARQWHFGSNRFSGTLPTEIGRPKDLFSLSLSDNEEMAGGIPSEIYSLTGLQDLHLSNCNFTGTINPLIGDLSGLDRLHLNSNRFSGQLPAEMGQLTRLQELWVNDNDFIGSVPQSVCQRFDFLVADLRADCLADDGTSFPEIECACCSQCCEREGQKCQVND